MARKPEGELQRGWTTGACATAASKAAYHALLTGAFLDPVTIHLPKGEQPVFALAQEERGRNYALAGIIKDAGDDPDVTHGALIQAKVSLAAPGTGVVFRAGTGVGVVSKAGLPVAVDEPAINPIPRQMMQTVIHELASQYHHSGDVEIELAIPNGAGLAEKTWNPRLGIIGGLSILGTTGVVIPYSCSAWIHSIQRGIDVARANDIHHVAGCTGSTSERALQTLYNLPDIAMLDMGDFAGGLLKYLHRHPIAKLSIGGGFAKLSKLAMGYLDLHSNRSQTDYNWLAERAQTLGADPTLLTAIRSANTANQVLQLAVEENLPLADDIAQRAKINAQNLVKEASQVEVLVFDRQGHLVGRSQN